MRYVILLISAYYLFTLFEKPEVDYTYNQEEVDVLALAPPNYQLYEYMKMYSDEYDIPFDFALNCAYQETGYLGKFDFRYRPFTDRLRKSYADAFGPLQVRVPTANEMWKNRTITENDLAYDIKLNVISSFRYKQYLFRIYKDWTKVYSVYNQGWKGSDHINSYAKNITGYSNT